MTSVWQRITAHALLDPERVAVVGEESLTYGELVHRVEEATGRLAGDYGPGDVIAVLAPTSVPGLIALLTVARTGAAFLPLDLSAPAARQEYVLGDSGARAVLRHDPAAPGGLAIDVRQRGTEGPHVPQDTAYLIYTSGSTGRPKGVLVPRQALLDRMEALASVPGFSADSSFLALTALSFDISLAELLLPLYTGGRVIMAPPSARLDPQEFQEIVERHRPDVIQATPSFWRLALATGWPGASDSVLWCGGEAMTAQLASRLRPLCRELWNVYGPTEATIWATAWRVDASGSVSLGTALPGSSCALVNEQSVVVTGPGAEGEIVLGGAGLALGYLGDSPDQRRFTSVRGMEGRVYRTGDLGRCRADGALEFLGRADTQVKFRGHRLELGELESVLEEHPAVQQAVVFLQAEDDPARAHLVALVAGPGELTSRQLRNWLAGRLPHTLIPKRIEVWASLPRTTAGKVDRVALRTAAREG